MVHLKSVGGVEGKPIDNDDMMLHIGDAETFPEFTENLRGVLPRRGARIRREVSGRLWAGALAGKTIRFLAAVKGVRKKELPEINDDFASDLGDFQNMEELRDAVRKSIPAEKTYAAQEEAKDKLVENWWTTTNSRSPRPTSTGRPRSRSRTVCAGSRRKASIPASVKLDWAKSRSRTAKRRSTT